MHESRDDGFVAPETGVKFYNEDITPPLRFRGKIGSGKLKLYPGVLVAASGGPPKKEAARAGWLWIRSHRFRLKTAVSIPVDEYKKVRGN